MSSSPRDLPAPAAPAEGCPPPLRAREVAEAWRAAADAWELPRNGYRLQGTSWGAGPALYFAPPFAGTAQLYVLTAWLLRDSFRCVLIDWTAPGHDWRRAPLRDVADFSRDLLATADHLGDRRFAVYGASFGAAVALQAAVLAPERLELLFLQGGFARRPLTWAERAAAWWYRRSRRTLAELRGRVGVQTVNHRRWFPPLDPDRWDFFLEACGAAPLGLQARQALAAARFDLRGGLSGLPTPVRLIATEGAGRIAADLQGELRGLLPQATEDHLHSTGQHPYLTHPHRLVKLMRPAWAEPLPKVATAPAGPGCDTSAVAAQSACDDLLRKPIDER